jgi:hypothetical protein
MSRSTSRSLVTHLAALLLAAALSWTAAQAAPGVAEGQAAGEGPAVAAAPPARSAPAAPDAPADPAGEAASPTPASSAEAAADEAVREWLARQPINLERLAGLDAEQLCHELPGIVSEPPPPPGTEVNLDDRVERTTPEDGDVRVFTYPASRPDGQLDLVEVRLAPADGGWEAVRVGFLSSTEPGGVRAWLQTPSAAFGFIALSVIVAFMLAQPGSPLRRWLTATRAAVSEHRRLVVITVLALYAVFGLGVLAGTTLPDSCDVAIVEIVEGAITSLGATAAYGSGDVPRAAVVTFYQNFVVVTLSVTFTLAAVLGVPAYLYAAFSFFVQGVPFGMIGGGAGAQLLVLLVVLVLELTSYFLVVAGGGMLLATVWRGGFGGLAAGFRKLLSTLPAALVLLVAAAWFEAAALILGF